MFRKRLVLMLSISCGLLLVPSQLLAQNSPITEQSLNNWFYSRIVWISVLFAGIGFLVGWLHLSRIHYKPPRLVVDGQARKALLIWVLIALIVGAILLIVDAWTIYPFSFTSLTFSEAFGKVFLSYQGFMVLLCAVAAFFIAAAIATRVLPESHCPHAFIPK